MNILIVKLSSLGDVVQTMPVVHDILRAHPGAVIDWVVEEAFAPLVQRVRGLGRVLPMGERRWRKTRWQAATRRERAAFYELLQTRSYDAVIDFQGLVKSALVARQARLAPGGFSATYANGSEACSYEWPVRYMLTRPLPMAQRIHAVARYRSLAGAALRYEANGPAQYALSVHPATVAVAAPKTVVLAHGTTRADNEWPTECWIDLARRLIADGWRIALPHHSAAELARCEHMATTLVDSTARGEVVDTRGQTGFVSSLTMVGDGDPGTGALAFGAAFSNGAVSVWPRMALAQVLDAMGGAAGVIGVDSGLSHMAVALDLPHVQIFSQPRAWRAGPVGRQHQVAVGGDAAPDVAAVWQAWQNVSRVGLVR